MESYKAGLDLWAIFNYQRYIWPFLKKMPYMVIRAILILDQFKM